MFTIHRSNAIGKLPLRMKVGCYFLPFLFCLGYLCMHECKNGLSHYLKYLLTCVLCYLQEETCDLDDDDEGENNVIEGSEEQHEVHSKRPRGNKEKQQSKQHKVTEDIILHKALDLMEKSSSNPVSRDIDDIFGEYVANELKTIKDHHMKRMIKFNIQSMLFHSLSQQSMPQMHASQLQSSFPLNTSQMPTSRPMNAFQMHGPPVSPWTSGISTTSEDSYEAP